MSRGRSRDRLRGGGSMIPFCCLFHVRSFLVQLLAIENITAWGGDHDSPRSAPGHEARAQISLLNFTNVFMVKVEALARKYGIPIFL